MTMPDPQATPFDPKESAPASDFSAPAEQIPAPEVPAPEAPSFPQSSAPDFDEATATPGSTTYGTAYDAAGAQSFPGPEQPAANQAPFGGAPGAQPSSEQPAYGSAGFGQPAYGQPAYGQQAYATPPKQWVLALLLAFFLGGFGVHNFYLGYTTRGIIQLLLTITFFGAIISCIWALIEFIMIAMRSGAYGCDASGQPLV
ncbi:NINE protein [uncultured Actinomyces sp.]|uniref:TM2 domain-containing protein n=1 Tax=uncultured Actinomyces sp. TaxID=249061 RepID=UPI0028EB7FB2|nr:NINE protein [uncultured Actinomyces sp.]